MVDVYGNYKGKKIFGAIIADRDGHIFDGLQKKKYRNKRCIEKNRRAELQNDRVIKNGLVISYYQYLIYLIERHCM